MGKSFRQSKNMVNINLNTTEYKIHNFLRIKISQRPFHLPLTLGRYFSHSCRVGQLLHQIQAAVKGIA